MTTDVRLRRNARTLVEFCGQVRREDRVLVITDQSTELVGEYLFEAANARSSCVRWERIPQASMHGSEPPSTVADAMLAATVILGATKSSLAHTQARFRATEKGARYLSLADYSLAQLASPALTVDFVKAARAARKIKAVLDKGEEYEVATLKGTTLKLVGRGRAANACPGFVAKPGTMGSPPDIETNIAPVENLSEGTVVIDGSIPCERIGVVRKPIRMRIEAGSIVEIDLGNPQGRILHEMFEAAGPKARVLAEFGFGLNPKAKLCGRMLEDEGCAGTVHFGFGSNITIGGRNKVNFHLDCVIRAPTVRVDGKFLLRAGRLVA